MLLGWKELSDFSFRYDFNNILHILPGLNHLYLSGTRQKAVLLSSVASWLFSWDGHSLACASSSMASSFSSVASFQLPLTSSGTRRCSSKTYVPPDCELCQMMSSLCRRIPVLGTILNMPFIGSVSCLNV